MPSDKWLQNITSPFESCNSSSDSGTHLINAQPLNTKPVQHKTDLLSLIVKWLVDFNNDLIVIPFANLANLQMQYYHGRRGDVY